MARELTHLDELRAKVGETSTLLSELAKRPINLEVAPALSQLDAVLERLKAIRSAANQGAEVVLDVDAEGSPRLPFSEYMNYMQERLNSLQLDRPINLQMMGSEQIEVISQTLPKITAAYDEFQRMQRLVEHTQATNYAIWQTGRMILQPGAPWNQPLSRNMALYQASATMGWEEAQMSLMGALMRSGASAGSAAPSVSGGGGSGGDLTINVQNYISGTNADEIARVVVEKIKTAQWRGEREAEGFS